ncbi:MAG TPA: D-erythronate dehydrogenase [Xanthobacteraceae bacterium]|nr:D-erythronate dehydrogenase [Xanthobacteraceae bacterium]
MHILITGAGGMIGRKLIDRLVRDGQVGGKAITRMTLHDYAAPGKPAVSYPVATSGGDVSLPGEAEKLVKDAPDLIFHLAAVVSGEAEADFEKGYRVNIDGMRYLLEAVRAKGNKPRFVFTSSIAVFGGDLPDPIPDDYHQTPPNSYGAAKVVCEQLLADYTRRGFLDGVGIRFPGITVRPGKPNAAASGFYSSIIREPLDGKEAILPVPLTKRNTHASPRAAIGFLIWAAEIDGARLGLRRNLNMPGVAVTTGEQIEALRKIAGDKVVARIRQVPDEVIMKIFPNESVRFDAKRALSLGFVPDKDFEEIIRIHIEEDRGGKFVQ